LHDQLVVDDAHVCAFEQIFRLVGQSDVGDEHVDIVDGGELPETLSFEFAPVRDEDDAMATVDQQGLDASLVLVGYRETPVALDGVRLQKDDVEVRLSEIRLAARADECVGCQS